MAKKNVKVKGVWFNLDLQREIELCQHADSLSNFSDFVKQKLAEDKLLKEQGLPESPELDQKELAALVENIVETKLAGRIVAPDQKEEKKPDDIPVDQFF